MPQFSPVHARLLIDTVYIYTHIIRHPIHSKAPKPPRKKIWRGGGGGERTPIARSTPSHYIFPSRNIHPSNPHTLYVYIFHPTAPSTMPSSKSVSIYRETRCMCIYSSVHSSTPCGDVAEEGYVRLGRATWCRSVVELALCVCMGMQIRRYGYMCR